MILNIQSPFRVIHDRLERIRVPYYRLCRVAHEQRQFDGHDPHQETFHLNKSYIGCFEPLRAQGNLRRKIRQCHDVATLALDIFWDCWFVVSYFRLKHILCWLRTTVSNIVLVFLYSVLSVAKAASNQDGYVAAYQNTFCSYSI